ncbi:signal peptidase I [Alicyclobacillus dauci]|uniref:Signal peptidase I n=1 Tax=Alicyclobacillus dauci TaxID=1475485 RepID=A0ABY6Z7G5_9BACL|nr:signal peptidase I [Alicyclobacillus dauci]WAH38463.1 signal peptidase I [Alicyclobacillus dauci]
MGQQKRQNWLTGWLLPIVIGVAIALCIRQWVVSAAYVPSESMYPTIPNPCYILVNKLATNLHGVKRGEVVVFHFPDEPTQLYVKRVVGLPGDKVTVTPTSVYINGKLLAEPNPKISKDNTRGFGTYQVPAGHYFMMGDNRPVSDDSRFWTNKYVSRSAIVGEADFVLFPFNKITRIAQHF